MIYSLLVFAIVSFFISGIPFGLLIGKIFKNVDIREQGSGNIGATNVARVIGFKYAVLTFILDGLKSFLPVLIAKHYYGFYGVEFASFIAFFASSIEPFSSYILKNVSNDFDNAAVLIPVSSPNIFL